MANKRREVLLTKMTAEGADRGSKTSPGGDVGRKPSWADYAEVQ